MSRKKPGRIFREDMTDFQRRYIARRKKHGKAFRDEILNKTKTKGDK
ncbi:hypothetical protein J7E55_13140 [Bacillus sp. ISL-53]|nr:hypothetical protein [Bacillus sp. ISL-53]